MSTYTDHPTPEGLLVRGTVLVVPGRGETRATYERLGRRLAADAWRVRVLDAPATDPDGWATAAARLGARLTEALAGTGAADDPAEEAPASPGRPLVLLGADTGAAALAALLAGPELPAAARPDGVVLAGLPAPGTAAAPGTAHDWDAELEVRTACPTHRGRLTDDADVHRGALDSPVPAALLAAAYESDPGVPALLLTGDADPLGDPAALARTAASLSRARLAVVRGAHHDVLNDLQHRAVAAEIVTFLETLRNGLVPLVAVESSTW
ncbi:alpha/beta hydrolase [Streptomyces physcomitrii]|uniref:alpha/beta hydrolase n=1 Tax=Streptomyces physcomitrii TaxID=2724184 RepID=UPI00343F68AC